jgi:transcriptional regulator with XRE-family HTH domain
VHPVVNTEFATVATGRVPNRRHQDRSRDINSVLIYRRDGMGDMAGELIHRARVERGWSLARLGRTVGVTGEAVRKWEGGRPPDRPTALALDQTLELHGLLLDKLGYTSEPGTVTLEGVDAKLDTLAAAIAEGLDALREVLALVRRLNDPPAGSSGSGPARPKGSRHRAGK